MPCIDDWLSDPLSIVQAVFGESGKSCPRQKIKEYFTKRLEGPEALARVPSLNDVPLHCLKPNSLVRYRCMIQDMYNPEYFAGIYQVINKTTGERTSKSALFSDVAQCPPNHELSFESHDAIMSRNVLYCVPIPGETTWAKKAYCRTDSQHRATPSPSHAQRNKRGLEDDDEEMSTDETGPKASSDPSEGDSASKRVCQSRNTSTGATGSSTTPELNFPLPGEQGPACIVKVYESDEGFKVNDMVEFVGVLSIDPALATFQSPSDDGNILQPDHMDLDEAAAHSPPPPSLVPRLHCILFNSLPHSNPLLPACLTDEEKGSKLQELCSVREELVTWLTQLLGGDALAAEYLLLHLISTVYSRVDIMAVGKFSLNLQWPSQGLSEKLYQLLQTLVPKAHMLSVSLSNMNSVNLVPKKDCSADRVVSGLLQLSDSTHLVLDETALQAGKLEEKGVRNVQTLTDLILWQKVQYDFIYHKTDFLTNIVILIISEGKSLLQSDCQLPVYPQHAPSLVENPPEELLTKIRAYLGLARTSPYLLSPDMQKVLEDDFVRTRQEDKNAMNADLFHSLLVISRLLSLSLGQTELTPKVWSRARELEQARNQRLGRA